SDDPLPQTMKALVGALDEELGIEMAPAARVSSGNVDLTRFEVVQWYFEHNDPESQTMDASARDAIQSYLEGGGAMLVSGSKLATNLDPEFGGDSVSGDFL